MTVKIAIAQMNSIAGDFAGNHRKIAEYARRAAQEGAQILLTPEMSLAGYPPEDLLLRQAFYAKSAETLAALAAELAPLAGLRVVVGHPLAADGARRNAASVLCEGRVLGTYCKYELPNADVFDERRYFSPSETPFVFEAGGVRFGLNICEDTWYPRAPARAAAAGAEVLLVLNGSPFHMGKQHVRQDAVRSHVAAQGMAAVYVNLVGGQDELLFDGNSFVMDRAGTVCAQLAHAREDFAIVEFDGARPLPQTLPAPQSVEAEVYQALVLGVRDYVGKNGFPGVIIGLSGGVDSALTVALAADALGPERVRTVMLPSPYTAEISWLDSRDMAARIGVRYDEIPIAGCFDAFRVALAPQFAGRAEDVAEENIQARVRGTLLMALSNKFGDMVLTTGNKSEVAVGYCTLYGDMAGGFAPLKDIAKTLVYRLCRYRNTLSEVIPERILTRAPSAELRPDQTDQDSLPPYEILDAIMQRYVEENQGVAEIIAAGYAEADVVRVTRLIKNSEYKRRQGPVGIRVTHRAFGRDWRYPMTSKFLE